MFTSLIKILLQKIVLIAEFARRQAHPCFFKAVFPPRVLTSLSPERTSSSLMSIRPSRRSVYRSVIRQDTRARWELTHLVKVFFCTASRSSASRGELTLPTQQGNSRRKPHNSTVHTARRDQQNLAQTKPPLSSSFWNAGIWTTPTQVNSQAGSQRDTSTTGWAQSI